MKQKEKEEKQKKTAEAPDKSAGSAAADTPGSPGSSDDTEPDITAEYTESVLDDLLADMPEDDEDDEYESKYDIFWSDSNSVFGDEGNPEHKAKMAEASADFKEYLHKAAGANADKLNYAEELSYYNLSYKDADDIKEIISGITEAADYANEIEPRFNKLNQLCKEDGTHYEILEICRLMHELKLPIVYQGVFYVYEDEPWQDNLIAYKYIGPLNADIELLYGTDRIAKEAFQHSIICSVLIPPSCTKIGSNAFADSSLKALVMYPDFADEFRGFKNYGYSDMFREAWTHVYAPKTGYVYGDGTIYLKDCKLMTEVFSGCCNITTAALDNCKFAGQRTFFGCRMLHTLTLISPEFRYDSKGDDILRRYTYEDYLETFPHSVKDYEHMDEEEDLTTGWHFERCTNLTEVHLEGEYTQIPFSMFEYCHQLDKITIPEGVTKIGENAFNECVLLQSIELPGTLEKIGKGAFSSCRSLESVRLRSKVVIADSAFINCTALQHISLKKCTEIGEYAFAGCTSLTKIKLRNCRRIKSYAFDECTALQSIDTGECADFGEKVFRRCPAVKQWETADRIKKNMRLY